MPASAWRELWLSDDLVEACAVSTTILAMEYEARLVDRDGRGVGPGSDSSGPFRVYVREADWPQLSEVVEEIVAEQAEFDQYLEGWRSLASRLHRALLLALIVIVAVLAIVGAIEL